MSQIIINSGFHVNFTAWYAGTRICWWRRHDHTCLKLLTPTFRVVGKFTGFILLTLIPFWGVVVRIWNKILFECCVRNGIYNVVDADSIKLRILTVQCYCRYSIDPHEYKRLLLRQETIVTGNFLTYRYTKLVIWFVYYGLAYYFYSSHRSTVKRSCVLERNYSFFILLCGLEKSKAQFTARYGFNFSKVTYTGNEYP